MFYDLAYERTRYPSWKWEHQLTLDSIRQTILPQIHQPVRVLEIGAGDGAFIQGIIPEVTTPKSCDLHRVRRLWRGRDQPVWRHVLPARHP